VTRRRLVGIVALAVVATVGVVAWQSPHWLALGSPAPRTEDVTKAAELAGSAEAEPEELTPELAGTARTKEDAKPRRVRAPLEPLLGVVVDEEGRGIAGVALYDERLDTREPLGRSAADGSFTLSGEVARVPEGDVAVAYLWPRAPGYVATRRSTRAHPGEHCRIEMAKGAMLRVRVSADTTRAPVADARVRAIRGEYIGNVDSWRRQVLPIDETRTDAQGRALLGVPEGTAYARVEAAGYAPNDSVVVMVGPEGADVEVLLAPGGRVRGVVQGLDGAAIAEADVRLSVGPLVRRETRTGADGRFAFDDVPSSEARDPWQIADGPFEAGLLTRAPGLATALTRVALPVAGGTVEVLVVLGPRRTLRGTVVEADDRPIAGVYVSVSLDDPVHRDAVVENAITDADGRFEFPDVLAGPVRLLTFGAGGREFPLVTHGVPVTGEVPPAVVRARPERGRRTLEVRVLDAADEPLADARVMVRTPAGRYLSQGPTDGDGRLEGTDLPPEALTVLVEAPGFGRLEREVDLAKGDVRGLTLKYPGGSSTVTVRRLDGSPARIEVYWQRWEDEYWAGFGDPLALDAQGTGTLRGLPDGEYALGAHTTGVVLVAGPSRFRPGAAGLTWTAATEAEARGMRTLLTFVDAATGKALEPTELRVIGAPREEEWGEGAAPGQYLAPPVVPGPYALFVRVPGHRPSTVERVELGRSGPVVTIRVPLDPGWALTGRVLDAAGQPVAGVSLFGPTGEFPCADDGTYRVTGLSAGPLSIEAHGTHVVTTTFHLQIAAPLAQRDFVVPVAGALRVVASRVVPNMPRTCSLRLRLQGEPRFRDEAQHSAEWRDRPDEFGAISGLAPGRYDLVIEIDGRPLPSRPVEIKARAETLVVLDPPFDGR
jgi:hypothetical protein